MVCLEAEEEEKEELLRAHAQISKEEEAFQAMMKNKIRIQEDVATTTKEEIMIIEEEDMEIKEKEDATIKEDEAVAILNDILPQKWSYS